MAGWNIPPEVAEAAKVAAAGGFGATVLVYLRHPGSLIRGAVMVLIGMGMASVFSDAAASIIGFGRVQCGALLGMGGLVVARKLLDWLERFDLARIMPWREDKT